MSAAQEERKTELNSSSSWFACCTNKFKCCYNPTKLNPSRSPPTESELRLPENQQDLSKKALQKRKHGGWKTMPFVLGNETFEGLASRGLLANFMVFLLTIFHMDQVFASNVINIWSGVTNFSPLLGAYISDAYLGRFSTIAYASVASLMGMVMFTLVAWLPQLHPPPCNVQTEQCIGATTSQFGILALGLALLSIGSTGIKPCSLPFGVDQFDSTTVEGKREITSFFNWYYAISTVVMIIALTVVVYIQSNLSWTLGFGIPTICMFFAIILFFVGTRFYVYVKPEGSVFGGIVQVIVASFKKRKLKLPEEVDVAGAYYDPIPLQGSVVKKLTLTDQMRFFNKAALVTDGSVQPDGSVTNQWRLSSVQRVEETKCLFKVIPVWASGIICLTAIGQQGTFTVSQALIMDRHMGPNFQIPAGSLIVISMITIAIWLPIYDRFVVPPIRKLTKVEGGITLLQRMGIGIIFSILSMIVSGLVEGMRRHSALTSDKPISFFWLAPQLILMGFAESFNIIGQFEFYNKEFPENMSSVANSLFSCTMGAASYISVIIVNVVHNTTGRNGHPDWLTSNINQGKVDNFYYVIAGLGILNFVYFLWISRGYRYKSRIESNVELQGSDVELDIVKP